MQDKKMKTLGLLTALSLAVCLIASGIVSDTDSSYAATSSLKWTQIPIPDEDDMQLYPGSDVGPIAVSPDGSAVFAAVNSSGVWSLLKSIDQAFTWQGTGLSAAMATMGDTGAIVAVKLSPNWNVDGFIFVATENSVYYSDDRGRAFEAMTTDNLGTIFDAGTDVITSLDIGEHEDFQEGLVVAVGTANSTTVGGDVYILDLTGWVAQAVGAYDVLAVGLSPNYAADRAIIAVVTDNTSTITRTKLGIGVWGATVFDATIKDQDGLDFVSDRACIGLPDNYKAGSASGDRVLSLFVGLSAAGPRGDVFNINGGWLSASTYIDLDIRGDVSALDPSETNIWSIDISGYATGTTLLVGTEEVNTTLLPNSSVPGQFLLYTSLNGGGSWQPNSSDTNYLSTYKQPTGETKASVAMSNSIAYVGTFGNQSAVSAAMVMGGAGLNSWNQHGLIDTMIDEVTDMVPSDGYFADGSMFITTYDSGTGDASLWVTQQEGRVWSRVYCSTLASPTACVFDMVRIAGDAVIVTESANTALIPSFDGGQTFLATRQPAQPVTAFTIDDENVYYTGDAGGGVWVTVDSGATWTQSTDSEIPTSDTVVDLVLTDDGDIYAGTNQGGIYKAGEADFTFVQVGPDTPGAPGDIVHVAQDLYDASYVYAGIQGGAASQGVWRFDQSDDEAQWEHIADAADVGDISSLACEIEEGILYAISSSTGTGWRCVEPRTAREEPLFEEIDEGLDPGDSVTRGLKLVSDPTMLFAVGGASYTQIWTTSDEVVKVKLLAPEDGSESEGMILDVEDEALLGRAVLELRWKEIQGADSYEVQIGYDEALKSPVEDMSYYDGGNPYSAGTVKAAYLWPGIRYYWRVRVFAPYMSQWSDTWSFTTPLGVMFSMPELLSPLPGQENVYLRPALQWSSCVDATGYELILAMNCDWGNPVLNLSGEDAITDTAYQLTFSLAKNADYCWKVRGVNDITHSPWSDSLSFTTGVTEEAEDEGLPAWIWVIIALATVFMLSILVLIVQSRK